MSTGGLASDLSRSSSGRRHLEKNWVFLAITLISCLISENFFWETLRVFFQDIVNSSQIVVLIFLLETTLLWSKTFYLELWAALVFWVYTYVRSIYPFWHEKKEEGGRASDPPPPPRLPITYFLLFPQKRREEPLERCRSYKSSFWAN